MAYVAPSTTTVGELITAAKLNQELRDNVAYLKGVIDGVASQAVTLASTLTALGTGAHQFGTGGDGEVGIGTAPGYPLHILSDDPAIATIEQRSANVTAGELYLFKSRGTLSAPGDVSAADQSGTLRFWGYRTGGYRQAAAIQTLMPTVGSSLVSGQISLWTATAGGLLTEALRITETQQVFHAAGTVAAPSIASLADVNTGVNLANESVEFVANGLLGFRVWDLSSTTRIAFFGATGIPKPTITGSRGANAALASLLTALHDFGLITNSTT